MTYLGGRPTYEQKLAKKPRFQLGAGRNQIRPHIGRGHLLQHLPGEEKKERETGVLLFGHGTVLQPPVYCF